MSDESEFESESNSGEITPKEAVDVFRDLIGLAGNMTDLAKEGKKTERALINLATEAKITEREVEKYRVLRDIAITEIIQKYSVMDKIVTRTFDDRRVIIEKHFEAIDKAFEDKNYDLVNSALFNLTEIAKSNPMKFFMEESLENPQKFLLSDNVSVYKGM